MVQEISTENLGDIVRLLQKYVLHVNDSFTTLDGLMKWYGSGLSKRSLYILAEYSASDEVIGLLVHSIQSHRMAMIFADLDFSVEKRLFDEAFKKFSITAPFLTFDSGYPTPWISDELSEYAVGCGFVKHDRQYMRLERNTNPLVPPLPAGLHVLQYSDSMLNDVTHLVFRSVDNTVDQDLFPYVYGTFDTTLIFHKQLTSGDFGTHKNSYSWVLEKDDEFVGSCFMISRNNDTGGVMHLAITPEQRQKGFGRILLSHSLLNLFKIEPKVTKIELAVTTNNPARILYESIGFRKVNDFSTYIWKR